MIYCHFCHWPPIRHRFSVRRIPDPREASYQSSLRYRQLVLNDSPKADRWSTAYSCRGTVLRRPQAMVQALHNWERKVETAAAAEASRHHQRAVQNHWDWSSRTSQQSSTDSSRSRTGIASPLPFSTVDSPCIAKDPEFASAASDALLWFREHSFCPSHRATPPHC
jgi:hypothetical protein